MNHRSAPTAMAIVATCLSLVPPKAASQTTNPPRYVVKSSHQINNRAGLQSSSLLMQDAPGSTIWREVGYVLAMETVFTGMSYLASREERYGPALAGGFDLFIGIAGIANGSQQKTRIQKVGHHLISAAFVSMAAYNWHFNKDHGGRTRFATNFVSFNVLVFTGYYLDTLN